MRGAAWLVTLLALTSPASAAAADRLADARRLYNQEMYELAIKAATEARDTGSNADESALVIARSHLERFRQTRDGQNLTAAQEALKVIDASRLSPRANAEFALALGQWLFLNDRFGAAAELFDSSVAPAEALGAADRDRVLDWWATAVDQQAQVDPMQRYSLYRRIIERMESELRAHPDSAAAGYWLPAAARSVGDTERAWHAAVAGYLRARIAPDRGAALRADLDRLVTTAIIPERARYLTVPAGNPSAAAAALTTEWEQLKTLWN
jgi:hypothetical protein